MASASKRSTYSGAGEGGAFNEQYYLISHTETASKKVQWGSPQWVAVSQMLEKTMAEQQIMLIEMPLYMSRWYLAGFARIFFRFSVAAYMRNFSLRCRDLAYIWRSSSYYPFSTQKSRSPDNIRQIANHIPKSMQGPTPS